MNDGTRGTAASMLSKNVSKVASVLAEEGCNTVQSDKLLLLAVSNAGAAICLSVVFCNYKSCRHFRSVYCAATSPRLPSILKEKLGKAGDKQRINSDYKKS